MFILWQIFPVIFEKTSEIARFHALLDLLEPA